MDSLAPLADAGNLNNSLDTAPTAQATPDANLLAGLSAGVGASSGVASDNVSMIGDFFGGGGVEAILVERVNTQVQAIGTVLQSVGNGDPNGVITFNALGTATNLTSVDLFSNGTGTDTTNDGLADTFSVSEPIPTTDVPVSPGLGYSYDGGQAVNPTGTYVNGDTWNVNYSFSRPFRVLIPNPSRGGLVVGKMKLAENGSPLPRNRLFFNYSFFDDVPLVARGIGVHRFTPGFESTFADELGSIEFRVPFASTASSQVFVDDDSQGSNLEMGDLFTTFKILLAQEDTWLLSCGVSVTAPTANDLLVTLRQDSDLVRIQNQAVHVMPFIGWRRQPSERWFWQGFMQLDVDAGGYRVLANDLGNGLRGVGRIHDATSLYVDLGWNYLLYEAPSSTGISAVIPTVELHYNRSLESTEAINTGGFQIGRVDSDIQQLNMSLGSTFFFGNRRSVTAGYVNPIGNGADQSFDGELRVISNWNF